MIWQQWFQRSCFNTGKPFGFARVVLVPDSLPIGQVIEEVLLLDRCSDESDWAAGVIYLPLR